MEFKRVWNASELTNIALDKRLGWERIDIHV